MKKYFVSGLIVLLPIVITLLIVNFFINLLTNPFLSLIALIWNQFGGLNNQWALHLSKVLILLLIATSTIVIGALAHGFVARRLLAITEFFVCKIPFVSTVYRASRDVIHTLLASKTAAFQEVLLVPFPHKESLSLGFLVREAPALTPDVQTSAQVAVFVPTTPNPTTGFILVFQKDQTSPTNISVEDALKYIISCGVIQPKSE